MKKVIYVMTAIVIVSACSPASHKEKVGKLTILHLNGSPYEQGVAHGQSMKSEIHAILERWISVVEDDSDNDFIDVRNQFFEATTYLDTIAKYCPALLDEVYGMSEGAGVEYETLLAFQMSEEMDALSGELNLGNCTSLSIDASNGKPTLLAQNMDPPLFLHGNALLLHISSEETGIESYVFTFPGFLGLDGMNSESVGVTCDGMSMLNHSPGGLPVAFMVRKILEQHTAEEAFSLVKNIAVGIPQCFTIGGLSGARCYECSANDVEIFYPFERKDISLHTNFAAANRDFSDSFINLLKQYGKTVDDPYYCPRYFYSYDKIVDYNFDLDVKKIKTILSSTEPEIEPVCNQGTYGCLIMELGENPVLNIAPDRPDSTGFLSFGFEHKSNNKWLASKRL